MKTRILMTGSALVMAALGFGAMFAPVELLTFIGVAPHRLLPALIQILGALYLGFAMVNWMAKDSLIGGIYNRPVSSGNLLHFAIGAITLTKLIIRGETSMPVIAAAIVYIAFAVSFVMVVFGSPVKAPPTQK